jgi:hypothetical protein
MTMSETLEALVIRKTHRVPVGYMPAGDGTTVVRQFDAVAMTAGFKLSRDLIAHLATRDPAAVIDLASEVLAVVRREAGDHVRHNTYFKHFPDGVPDTMDFWLECLTDAMADPVAAGRINSTIATTGFINLLDLPKYGRYQHSYEEMLAVHDELVPRAGDRLTTLHLGDAPVTEARRLYAALAGSTVPLAEVDLAALRDLATLFGSDAEQPAVIPVRENRAVINAVRLAAGQQLLADTADDVLRVAAVVSDGDVTLAAVTRFRSFRRTERRVLLGALDQVVHLNHAKLGDVPARREQWKRLAERLHPADYPWLRYAQSVFAVARGDEQARSFAGAVELFLAAGDVRGAATTLAGAPGRLFRQLDHLLRLANDDGHSLVAVLGAAAAAAPNVSGRLLLSMREHLQNRLVPTDVSRVFANRNGRAWVTADKRGELNAEAVEDLLALIDAQVAERLSRPAHLVIDPAIRTVALPLSGKYQPGGLGVLPRGSVVPVDGETLRFFIYWRETERRTDYDLSALMLDATYQTHGWLSYTALSGYGGVHSGDITSAPAGASEFIDLHLPRVGAQFIVPMVNVFAGEGFEAAAESFFGFMTRDRVQRGTPFDPRTVRMKSDMRGAGRVALPMAFMRGDDGKWRGKWLHLYTKGQAAFNRVENNRVTTSLLARAILERDYLRVGYLADMMRASARHVSAPGDPLPDAPVTHIGFDTPELPAGSTAFTPLNLAELVPA